MYSVLDPSRHRRMFQSIRELATTIFLFPVGEGGGKKIEKPLMFYMNSPMRLQKLSKGNSRTKMLANSWLFNFQSLTNFLPSFASKRMAINKLELFLKKQNVSRKWNFLLLCIQSINFAISLFENTIVYYKLIPVFSNLFLDLWPLFFQ